MIGLFSCVYSQVAFQCLQMAETSATDLTWIWLLSGMNQNVSPKVSNLCKKRLCYSFKSLFLGLYNWLTRSTHLHKSSAACLTLVWLFSWVNPCVGFEVCWSVELSSADIASIWFLSCKSNEKEVKQNIECQSQNYICSSSCLFLPVWTVLWLARFPL